jgi:hypothetical protein
MPDQTTSLRQQASRPPAALPGLGLARVVAVAAVAAIAAVGCTGIEDAPARPLPSRADRSFELDAPPIMRGTVASESIMLGYEPVVVRGYGLVVGLRGTGSGDVPPAVRAHMLAEMALRGVGQQAESLGHLNPERMLNSSDTAVVIVEGVVPPGAVGRETRRGASLPGTLFDIRVFADPRSGTISLEGGRLYTAELRPAVPGEIYPATGSRQAAALAEAKGSIFVNPFAEPGAIERDAISRTNGRILNGGEVLEDMPLKLRLATPSHARADVLQSAINTRFPQEPGQRNATAHGESAESIRINVPPSYRHRPEEFVELLRHTSIRQAGAEATSLAIRRFVVNDPSYAVDASWRWRAIGERAKPTIRELYDSPDDLPRMAALRAGAYLDDALVTPNLVDMAAEGQASLRVEAIDLLGNMGLDPQIDRGLHELLDDPDVDVRLAAYEALVKRADPMIQRRYVDDKYIIDVVDSEQAMIYVSQARQPRIAIFGSDLALNRPMVMDMWSGRLLMQADADDPRIEVYYRDLDTGDSMIETSDPTVVEFVEFLGHKTSVDAPAPGLGLAYGDVVGVLYRVWREQHVAADFKAQQDRVLAAIMRQRESPQLEQRPEFSEYSDPDFDMLRPETPTPGSDDVEFIDLPGGEG